MRPAQVSLGNINSPHFSELDPDTLVENYEGVTYRSAACTDDGTLENVRIDTNGTILAKVVWE